MKKISCILLVMLVSLTFISCGDSEDKKAVDKSVNVADEEVNNDTVDDKKVEDSEHKIYMDKLNKVQDGLKDLDRLYTGSAPEMKTAVNEEYKRWDNALNEIYNVLRNKLSISEMSILEKEELQWIKEKESKAKEVSFKFKGGTAETLIYMGSLANTTKDRSYELVRKYMEELV